MMMRKSTLVSAALWLAGAVWLNACATLNPKTEQQLETALVSKTEAFQACYQTALERNRETQGSVGLSLEIAKDTGIVTKSSISKTDIQDTMMNQCVAAVPTNIQLADPPGVAVEGRYTIQFAFE